MAGLRSRVIKSQDPLWEGAWIDGLPVVPPTRERVAAMLTATDRDPGGAGHRHLRSPREVHLLHR